MPFPKTFDALVAAGYTYSGQSRCAGCNERIEWWRTPNKHAIPLNLIIERDVVTPHHATCSHVEQFRKPARLV